MFLGLRLELYENLNVRNTSLNSRGNPVQPDRLEMACGFSELRVFSTQKLHLISLID